MIKTDIKIKIKIITTTTIRIIMERGIKTSKWLTTKSLTCCWPMPDPVLEPRWASLLGNSSSYILGKMFYTCRISPWPVGLLVPAMLSHFSFVYFLNGRAWDKKHPTKQKPKQNSATKETKKPQPNKKVLDLG